MKISTFEKISYKFMGIAKFFLKFSIYILIIFLIGTQLFNIGIKLFKEESMSDDDTTNIVFEIKESDTLDEIATNMKNAGLIKDERIFKFRAKIYNTNFKPGTYNLNKTMTTRYMLDIFDSSETTTTTLTTTETEEEIYSPENE